LPEEQRKAQTLQREEHYLTLILSAYKAERMFQLAPFHGKHGSTVVLVGPIDAPVTLAQVNEAIDACRQNKISKADILGFEFEWGWFPPLGRGQTKGCHPQPEVHPQRRVRQTRHRTQPSQVL
jgi:hypothetical protein